MVLSGATCLTFVFDFDAGEIHEISVSLAQNCELRKRTGVAGLWDWLVTKVSTPFQPDIPDFDTHKDSETRIHFKTLKHPFIRDKLHL